MYAILKYNISFSLIYTSLQMYINTHIQMKKYTDDGEYKHNEEIIRRNYTKMPNKVLSLGCGIIDDF